jgi:dynein heavy chain
MSKLLATQKNAMEGDRGRDIQKTYDGLVALMLEFEQAQFSSWCNKVAATSDAKLNQPLLFVEGSVEGIGASYPRLNVNFDPDLVRLLRETKYFLLLKCDVPESASAIYQSSDMFRQQISSLELICSIHNKINQTILPVEKPLVQQKLDAVELSLKRGLHDLSWKSDGIDTYVKETMDLVKDLDLILTTIKDNVKETIKILKNWEKNLMFERKEGKTYTFEELNDSFSQLIQQRHSDIRDGGKEITKLLSGTIRVLKVSKGVPSWKRYVDYFSDIVIDGFSAAIIATIKYLLNQIDPEVLSKSDTAPLMEIQLELVAAEIVWKPELAEGKIAKSVRDMVKKWLKSFCEIGQLMKRLDIGEGNYMKELEEDYDVFDAMNSVISASLANEERCEAFKKQYQKFDFLWTKELHATLNEFKAAEGKTLEDGTKDDPPLAKFEEQIAKYKSLSSEITALPGLETRGWVKINAKPLRTALLTWVSKWTNLFTSYLSEKVINSMTDLYSFMETANATLELKVLGEVGEDSSANSYLDGEEKTPEQKEAENAEKRKALYDIMTCMRDVRKRTERTDGMFEPLRQTVASLTGFGLTLPDTVIQQLENAEHKWKLLKKKMYTRKEQLTSLQQTEAIEIRRKSDAFGEKVEEYRKFFQRRAPFGVPPPATEIKLEFVKPSYKILDEFRHGSLDGYPSVSKIVAESKQLQEAQELFELFQSDYIYLQRCGEELLHLKSVWDMVGTVMYTFNDWSKTSWDKIDVDFLVEESKKLAKDIKSLNKAVRNYEVFRLLEEAVKGMLTSLPLVQELHDPAMRDRHWTLLMQTTGKQFVMDEKFCLGDLLALEVRNIPSLFFA